MRKINKPIQVPQQLLDKQAEIEADLIRDKNNFDFQARHHSAPIYQDLKQIYHGKCAYCENKLVFSGDFDNRLSVEHYRPKSAYWWLYLEWTNLFPVCKKLCNTPKGDDFPISGTPATVSFLVSGGLDWTKCKVSAVDLMNEKPLLLHPDVDNGADFFYFKPNGEIAAQDGLSAENEIRANSMLFILNNSTHVDNRRAEIDQMQTDFINKLDIFAAQFVGGYSSKNIENHFLPFFTNLYEMSLPEQKYSLLFESMLLYFDSFFLTLLNPTQLNIAIEAIDVCL